MGNLPLALDNSKKLGLIPDMTADRMVWWWKDLSAGDGPAAYQLVGGVVAYQGDDGSRPERVTGHTGTETRPRLLREAAVGNIAQWAKA